ncbi:unnamed protein product [Protopolystoma xenopodis]|uniref:Uncharacterized protein n=1 Tax=Protopolystoma xenopodis TaxID=117903 RepID=A0A3S5FG97_9PLAT|nr:unnamed protein product [Protopolystoma xenopodis]
MDYSFDLAWNGLISILGRTLTMTLQLMTLNNTPHRHKCFVNNPTTECDTGRFVTLLEIHICPVTQGHSWQCGVVVNVSRLRAALSWFESR